MFAAIINPHHASDKHKYILILAFCWSTQASGQGISQYNIDLYSVDGKTIVPMNFKWKYDHDTLRWMVNFNSYKDHVQSSKGISPNAGQVQFYEENLSLPGFRHIRFEFIFYDSLGRRYCSIQKTKGIKGDRSSSEYRVKIK